MIHVYFVAGPAASGKSEFARLLAGHLKVAWIDLDDDFDKLTEVNSNRIQQIGMEVFLAESRVERYSRLVNRAMKAVAKGDSVIVSAPFTAELNSIELWQKMQEPLVAAGANVSLYWINTDPEERRNRMVLRAAERDKEKISGYVFTNIVPAVTHKNVDGKENFSEFIEQEFLQ